ncbi:MAG: T9SS type A sorting domain-containing protein [Crocinitomicaceae bacterium]|nr:T9SS type A sorting domain-containing protein [Crocinitomicaceae bacterium]
MKKIVFFSMALLLSMTVFSQNDNTHNCFKRNAFTASQLKSNSLTVSQQIETEKYDVHFYLLDVAMTNLSTDISGTGEIHGTTREILDSVLFELFDTYLITDIRLNGVSTPYSRVGSAIKVPVNLTANQSFEIAVDYSGTPPTAATNPLGGAGMTNDNSPSWGNYVTWSLSEPFSAYEWWPCKQSLRDKADSCEVKITVPNNCKAGSNGSLEAVIDLGNGTSRYEWKHGHSIEYYLISVAVAEYIEYNVYANPTGSPSPILIQNYIYDNPATLPAFQTDIDETVDFIELFSDVFGLYPFHDEKYGHCMAPLSGGMEHQTMTTQGYFTKGLTAHELGHQWWGNNVTCASWSDIWVNEGFASYCEYIMLENLYPNETALDMESRHDYVKSNPNGSVWVLDSLNESRIFNGRLTYDKGASIIHTFRFIMDDDPSFFQALKNIQTDYADSVAIGLDFKEAFEAASGDDLTDAFQEWYFGEGFPTYSARWNVVGNDLLLEVSHTTSSSTPTFTNPIEIEFSRAGMSDTTIRFSIDANLNQFLVPNMSAVDAIDKIDPNNWIINNVGTITNDPAFTAGIEDIITSQEILVFPNPSQGSYTLETNVDNEYQYKVFDTKGKIIQSGLISQTVSTLDISENENGYYILHLSDTEGNRFVKILIKE